MANDLNQTLAGHGEPTKQGIDTLTSGFKQMLLGTADTTTNFGADQVNRLRNYLMATNNNVAETLLELMRVNRTPVATATEDLSRRALAQIKETLKELIMR